MNILILLIFIGAILIVVIAYFFVLTVKNEEYEHLDEVSWLPLEEDNEERE